MIFRDLVLTVCLTLAGSVTHVAADADSTHVSSRTKRVFGGEVVKDNGRWPWAVSITWSVTDYGMSFRHTCPGSLLNEQWVLTSAHCLPGPGHNIKVRLGDVDIQSTISERLKDTFGRIFHVADWMLYEIKPAKIFKHPNFKGGGKHDLALVKLTKKVPHTAGKVSQIQSISLPDPKWGLRWPKDGEKCVVMGWGCHRKKEVRGRLTSVEIPKTPDKKCKKFFGRTKWDIKIQMCAGLGDKKLGTCYGDSGGPLVCKRKGKWIQAGVLSHYGSQEAKYVRVSAYVPWIKDTIKADTR